MSKKKKALHISALLTAVSGASLLVSADNVRAAEIRTPDERCWDRETPMTPLEYRLHNCEFVQYGLQPSDSPLNDVDTPSPGGGGATDGGPTPVDPYTSGQ
jgi:hypothetical protein